MSISDKIKNLVNDFGFIRLGSGAEHYSKRGLGCINDFERKIGAAEGRQEIEQIIEQYEDKISAIGRKHNYAFLSTVLATLVAPALAIDRIFEDNRVMACYLVSFAVAQVGDWTYKVAKMKENPDFAGSWTSYYPYKDIFTKKVGLIKAFMSKDNTKNIKKFQSFL